MPGEQTKVPEAVSFALKSIRREITEKALKLNLNGSTNQFIDEQMNRVRKEYYGLPPEEGANGQS